MFVVSTPSFNKDISKIKDKAVAKRVEQTIIKMQSVGTISELPGVKKMAGASDAYRIRIADYRLGFRLSGDTIKLVVFAHRKEIYRHFP